MIFDVVDAAQLVPLSLLVLAWQVEAARQRRRRRNQEINDLEERNAFLRKALVLLSSARHLDAARHLRETQQTLDILAGADPQSLALGIERMRDLLTTRAAPRGKLP